MKTMPPDYLALNYTPETVHQLFARVAHLPWAMLLSSGFASHADNRFDIMVADPYLTLLTTGQRTRRQEGDNVTYSLTDPLTILQQALNEGLPSIPSDDNYPFQGGALGLFGYDLGRRFETLPDIADQDLATPDMAVGMYNWTVIADHQQKKLTLIDWVNARQRYTWLESLPLPPLSPPLELTGEWQSNMSGQQYREKFQQIQNYLHAGDCYQVNLGQRFQAPYQGDEWQAFCQLNQQNRAPFSAFIRLPDSAIICLSPERFLSLNDGIIETRPIKGTLPRQEDPDADQQQAIRLANSAKDQAENLMIVDLLRNDIGRVAQPGSVHVPELFVVEPFPAVYHLVSTIRATLRCELQATDLLRACFPGGSITGAPKVRAMEIIEELEPQRRNAWCGSIGYISQCGRMDTNITIRTLVAEQGKLFCTAGGGIIADSQVDQEYQETLDKVNRILPCLNRSPV